MGGYDTEKVLALVSAEAIDRDQPGPPDVAELHAEACLQQELVWGINC
jgi:hypothetical protein